jgi:ABC-2 type transport system permease protein
MSKVGLIIKREYSTRVKKKSFIIMTILGPLLFAGLIIGMFVIMKMEDDEYKKIAVIDETGYFDKQSLTNTQYIEFDFVSDEYLNEFSRKYDTDKAKSDLVGSEYFALLYIPKNVETAKVGEVEITSFQQPPMGLNTHITNGIERKLEDIKLSKRADELGISENAVNEILKLSDTNVHIITKLLDKGSKEEKETSTEASMIIGYLCGLLIYMFVFMYGSQVMQGVIEEKSNRIIEVIVSSVKPFQLMIGKIIGVALVGLTQFLLWIVLTFGIVTVAQSVMLDEADVAKITQNMDIGSQIGVDMQSGGSSTVKIESMLRSVAGINITQIVLLFIVYFLGGYLLYAALFAAIGSAVDNEADTQQFVLPITIPLILGIVVMLYAINNPSGSLAYWFSLIPFTSPIVMLVRLPFGVPIADIIISLSLLVLTFIFMTWFAAKIYRVGILMYGKKVDYKELWKWFRYKN